MSQYPHDQFDDVPPYQSDEIGKHRAPGAAAAGRSGSGLKWIGLLAAVVLLVGLLAYFVFPMLRGEDEPTAGEGTGDAEVAEEESAGDEGSGETETEGDGETEGEDSETAESADVDTDYPLTIYNYGGPEGTASSVGDQLTEAGFNVAALENWTEGWNTCDESTPVVVHGEAQADLAELVAEEVGGATCHSEAWGEAGTVAVAVGPESAP